MTRLLVGSIAVWLVAQSPAYASNSNRGQILALQAQVKALRAEGKTISDAVRARYQALIHRDHLTEAQLHEARKELTSQEETLLKMATTQEDRGKIRAEFDSLRSTLRADYRMEEGDVARLRQLRQEQLERISRLYKARIAQLQQEIKALQAADKAAHLKKK